ncbi:hypothetical protein SNOG_07697 [Parastagonospora nodorum SN15]|uniref:Uncharacterized protein n=1 Tax=Phaeosphaeria nodorum (strain SN15 / ATCC MYA-4574 / FGSC 10173) TaxID=321614 RepID=Q0UKL7_PHANO|nr:hypothetical protein SNOG_07697 [Parastagonospora nodorum SN15]EAT85163.1 hypothetical protein SNOG_07697 [Parastagonospora nodorum SN15]
MLPALGCTLLPALGCTCFPSKLLHSLAPDWSSVLGVALLQDCPQAQGPGLANCCRAVWSIRDTSSRARLVVAAERSFPDHAMMLVPRFTCHKVTLSYSSVTEGEVTLHLEELVHLSFNSLKTLR